MRRRRAPRPEEEAPDSERLGRCGARIGGGTRAARGFCILVQLHELRRPPAGVVAGATRREHGLSAGAVADEPPRFAPDILIEWMRMPDLRRDGFAAVGADGAERLVSFGSASAAASRHDERPDLFAPRGAEPGGAPARWLAPGIGSLPRGDRSGAAAEGLTVG